MSVVADKGWICKQELQCKHLKFYMLAFDNITTKKIKQYKLLNATLLTQLKKEGKLQFSSGPIINNSQEAK